MVLAPGVSLLQFRLAEKIGEGGMGEVWRARDASLERDVAIKVLPPALARDPERLARFEREAKVLAALNHTNIAAIYGFHEATPTAGVEPLRFLAMEMVPGEDLAQILARGPLPVREALDAARQIAAALEAAHDRGIVHRDLKPANVRRTPEGQIKVLDFGLAKALETAATPTGQSATVTSAGTQAGVILGTASYMSPEQARGLVVDRRTDLWAFGCVLYEMVCGTRAFDGPTVTDVLAAIVTGEPDWEKLPVACPTPVRRLLRRCLEKDPRKRLRDAGDASLLLEENPEDARTGPVRAAAPAPRRRRPLYAALALAAVAAAVLGGYGLAHLTSPTPAATKVVFRRVTSARGMLMAARFAPEGNTIVYAAAWDGPPLRLYLARADSPESTPLAIPPAELLAVSRTGELAVALGLAYRGWMGEGTLGRTSLLGGTPREIAPRVRSADWSPDGTQFAVARRAEGGEQLEYPIGTVLYRTTGYVADVRVSPDGAHVAFTDHPVWADDRGDLAVVDRSGKKTTLAADYASIHGAVWSADGREVWSTGQSGDAGYELFACALDGGCRVILPSIPPIAILDRAPDGRVLLAGHTSTRGVVAQLAGWGAPRALIVPGEASLSRSISPDGRLAIVSNQYSKEYETYLVRAADGSAVRLSSGDGAQISSDGRQILAVATDAKTVSVTPIGMGTTREIPNPDGVAYEGIPVWIPDDRRFVVTGRRPGGPSRAFAIDAETGKATEFGPEGLKWELLSGPPFSPDGRFAVLQDAAGTNLRVPLDGGAPLPIPGLAEGDRVLAWCADGGALFVAPPGIATTIDRLDLATGRRTPVRTIETPDAAGIRSAFPTITPDGKHWAVSTSRLLSELFVVEGLR